MNDVIDIDEEEVDEGGEKERGRARKERASAASLGVPTYELNDDIAGRLPRVNLQKDRALSVK